MTKLPINPCRYCGARGTLKIEANDEYAHDALTAYIQCARSTCGARPFSLNLDSINEGDIVTLIDLWNGTDDGPKGPDLTMKEIEEVIEEMGDRP